MEDFSDILDDMEQDAAKSITVEEFDEFVKGYDEERIILKDLEDKVSEQKGKIDGLNAKLADMLEALGRTKYSAPNGLINIVKRDFYAHPKGDEKEKFFGYLRERGLLESVVSVNSQSLQKLIEGELEGKPEGWLPPGVNKPFEKQTVRYTRSKK